MNRDIHDLGVPDSNMCILFLVNVWICLYIASMIEVAYHLAGVMCFGTNRHRVLISEHHFHVLYLYNIIFLSFASI